MRDAGRLDRPDLLEHDLGASSGTFSKFIP
jgi:hypothetical protein